MKELHKISLIILCLVWIGFIFYMSSDSESNAKTKEIAIKIESKVRTDNPIIAIKKINYFIRKAGHFIEYAILGLLLYFLASALKFKLSQSYIYILFISLIIANIDELYQKSIGRTSLVSDCIIDLLGSIAGLTLGIVINKVFEIYVPTRFDIK